APVSSSNPHRASDTAEVIIPGMGSRGWSVTVSAHEKLTPLAHSRGRIGAGFVSISAEPSAFFNKTYDETLGLLVEVRDYVADSEPADRRRLAPVIGAKLSCEALRVTARLTQIMAWLH